MFKKRIDLFQEKIHKNNLEGFIVTNCENIRYLTRFTGNYGIVFFSNGDKLFITDARYFEQANNEISDFKIILQEETIISSLITLIKNKKIKRIGLETKDLKCFYYNILSSKLEDIELILYEDFVEQLREIKDEEEITLIKKAVEIADRSFEYILKLIKPGLKEKDIAIELEYFLRKNGSYKIPFEIIIASGRRSSFPHGIANDKILVVNEPIIIDFGANFNGYNSDLTRTIFLGKPEEEFKKIYELVLLSQKLALEKIKAGISCEELDSTVRNFFKDHTLETYFLHGLGHGIGLAVHEAPIISRKSQKKLSAQMVVSVEPGIYFSKLWGIRIEDLVVIRENSCEILTQVSKKLITL